MAPRPNADHIKVATDDLQAEASHWSSESDKMTALTTKIANLKFDLVQGGLFIGLVSKHSEIVDFATARCKEGTAAFDQVSTALRKAANTYENEDLKFADQLQNLW